MLPENLAVPRSRREPGAERATLGALRLRYTPACQGEPTFFTLSPGRNTSSSFSSLVEAARFNELRAARHPTPRLSPVVSRPPQSGFLLFSFVLKKSVNNESAGTIPVADKLIQKITLSGGSLGSPVDEERSQLREPMRIAGHKEHQYFERTLRPPFFDVATPVRGSLSTSKTRLGSRPPLDPIWGARSRAERGFTNLFSLRASSLSVQS